MLTLVKDDLSVQQELPPLNAITTGVASSHGSATRWRSCARSVWIIAASPRSSISRSTTCGRSALSRARKLRAATFRVGPWRRCFMAATLRSAAGPSPNVAAIST